MNKNRSGQYKSRNLPKDFKVVDQVKSKPIMMLVVMLGVGVMLTLEKKYFLMGIVILGFSAYHLLFRKNVSMVEFGEEFAVFYTDETREDCQVVYYDDIQNYTYKDKKFDTDLVIIHLTNGKTMSIKALDKKKVKSNLEKHIK